MVDVAPTSVAPGRGPRVLSLVVLIACALAPGLVALAQGAPPWVLSGVLPLLVALVILARDHDRRIELAASRLVAVERERARLADSVRHVGRAFGSALDLPALTEVMAGTASDALDAQRALVRIGEHVARGGAADRVLDDLLEAVATEAVEQATTAFAQSVCVHHAMAHPVRGAGGVLAVARTGRPFTGEEQRLLVWLAGQAAVSVHNVALHERLRTQAQVDELTGLGNQRVFHESLAGELTVSGRLGAGVGLILLDLDDFKLVNDQRGHPTGDRLLAAVGQALQGAVRGTDIVTRWGGEEFAVVLPHTDLAGAAVAAEAARAAIAELRLPVPGQTDVRVTVSVGVAASPSCGRDPTRLYSAADRALYDAKARGKDCVVLAEPGARTRAVA